ncbi:hypothetical protein L2E82_19264 [Cichorium intybus]|uniref:Uncharacterized protein n=1 Tax=Cichorium intybus TaxID=13427 RepID=A0ACB9FB14_CICIN|nr:hypothetical protein L2E82_19264 [Cichorium intybus]
MGKPHALLVPYAAQGHVIPMMELMQRLVKHGVKVTFLNTDFTHKLVTEAFSKDEKMNELASFVSLPDGVEEEEDRKDVGKLADAIFQVMPAKLEELIIKLNGNEDGKVTCIVADTCMGWAFRVGEKMKIKSAAFWTATATTLATLWSIEKFLEDGIVDDKGILMKKQMVQLSPTTPAINSENFMWVRIGDLKTQEIAFDLMIKANEFFEKDESGIISREEIKNKIQQLLEDNEFKVRATDLKEKVAVAVSRGGQSDKNFSNFIDWIHDTK